MSGKSIVLERQSRRTIDWADVTARVLRIGLRVVVYGILVVWAGVSLLPIYWMLTTSIKAATTMLSIPPQWLPHPISFVHYETLFAVPALPRWIFNTAFVSTIV